MLLISRKSCQNIKHTFYALFNRVKKSYALITKKCDMETKPVVTSAKNDEKEISDYTGFMIES